MREWNHPKPKQNVLFHYLLWGDIEKWDYKITWSVSNLIWDEHRIWSLRICDCLLLPLWTCTKLKTLRGRVYLTGLGEQVFPLPFIHHMHSGISTSLKKPGLGPTPFDARRQTLSPDKGSECCPLAQAYHTLALQLPSRLSYSRLHRSLRCVPGCPPLSASWHETPNFK